MSLASTSRASTSVTTPGGMLAGVAPQHRVAPHRIKMRVIVPPSSYTRATMRTKPHTATRACRSSRRPGVLGALLFSLAAMPLAQGQSQEPAVTMPDPLSQQGRQSNPGGDRRVGLPAGLTSEALSGPPSPGTLYAVVDLSDRQMAAYVATYRNHMTATWPVRHLLVRAVDRLLTAVAQQDEPAMLRYETTASRLWREIAQWDTRFDATLEGMLSKDQFKRYRQWDAKRRRGAEAEQRLRSLGRQGASPIDTTSGGPALNMG